MKFIDETIQPGTEPFWLYAVVDHCQVGESASLNDNALITITYRIYFLVITVPASDGVVVEIANGGQHCVYQI